MPDLEIRQRPVDLTQAHFAPGLPDWMQRILVARQIHSDADRDLALASLLHPSSLAGLEQALDLLEAHLRRQSSILILGDYDADGATSCALMIRVLRAMDAQQVDFLVPNRFDYGYGLSPEIVEVAARRKPDLIITVDNGIASIEGVAAAQQRGIQVLVTDHHLPGRQLPAADAIVNPNQPGCPFPSKNLAGVGVAFYLLSALRLRLRERGWFEAQQIGEPRMADWLDLVALGTVADVVPLDKNNRVLVSGGLQCLHSGRGNPGIRALFEVAGRDWLQARSTDLGFVAGPRINAAGRLDDISLGVQCLLTDDEQQARQLAAQLHQINSERRVIEQQMQEESLHLLEQLGQELDSLPLAISLFREDWHQGVVGLLASRVKDRLHRPVIAFARDKPGELKGSGRSIPGFHLRDALDAIATRHPGMISKFGGHAMAAGLSLAERQLAAFSEAFDQIAGEMLDEADLQQVVWTDGKLPASALTLDTARQVRDLLPWGQRCPEPQFEGEFVLRAARVVGEKHLRLELETGEGQRLQGIWFNADFDALSEPGTASRLVFRLSVNDYRGEALQLQIVHWNG